MKLLLLVPALGFLLLLLINLSIFSASTEINFFSSQNNEISSRTSKTSLMQK